MLSQKATAGALQQLREFSGLSRRRAARQIGVDKRTLQAWEECRSTPDSDQVSLATRVYGRDLDWLVTSRERITDPSEPGIIRVGDEAIDIAEIRRANPGIHEANRATLNAYVDAVRRARAIPVAGIVELRALDVTLLSRELDITDPELMELLESVFNLTPAGAQSAARAVLIGALMTLAAATGLAGGAWFAPAASASPAQAEPVASASATPVDSMFTTFPYGDSSRWTDDQADIPSAGTPNGDRSYVFSVNPREDLGTDGPESAQRPPALAWSPQALPAAPAATSDSDDV